MTVSHAMLKAAIESRAHDDHGLWESLGDLLGFSGENMTQIVVRAALEAAEAKRTPPPPPELTDMREDFKRTVDHLRDLVGFFVLQDNPARVPIENFLAYMYARYFTEKT